MSTGIIVAIIGAIAGIAGAITAWVQSVRVARINAETNRAIEDLKASNSMAIEKVKANAALELERFKAFNLASSKAYEQACADVASVEAKITQSWQYIQLAKEALLKLSTFSKQEPEFAATIDSLKGLYSEIAEAYRLIGPEMPGTDTYILHGARDSVGTALLYLNFSIEDEKATGVDCHQIKEQIMRVRDQLTTAQVDLLRVRESLRQGRASKIMAGLLPATPS